MGLTSCRVDAGCNVEVAESVGLRNVAPALPVAVVTALVVRQAAGERELKHVPVSHWEQGLLKEPLQ